MNTIRRFLANALITIAGAAAAVITVGLEADAQEPARITSQDVGPPPLELGAPLEPRYPGGLALLEHAADTLRELENDMIHELGTWHLSESEERAVDEQLDRVASMRSELDHAVELLRSRLEYEASLDNAREIPISREGLAPNEPYLLAIIEPRDPGAERVAVIAWSTAIERCEVARFDEREATSPDGATLVALCSLAGVLRARAISPQDLERLYRVGESL